MNWSNETSVSHLLELPSKCQVPIEWDKLASVDYHELSNGHCSVEILQEHLNHVAFSCPQTEFKLDSPSGQRNMLKMFKLAQLIIQYLFISQEYMESKLNQNSKEYEIILHKYQEIKKAFQKQVEEAKKIKNNNTNLKESLTYTNSFLSNIGALEHYRCPICPKAFRNKDFLHSHLERKHPLHKSSVDINKCIANFPQSKHENEIKNRVLNSFNEVTLSNEQHCKKVLSSQQPSNNTDELLPNFGLYQLPSNEFGEVSKFDSGTLIREKSHETNFPSKIEKDKIISEMAINFSDNSSEIQTKFEGMNKTISKLQHDIEWQKNEMKLEKEKTGIIFRKLEKEKQDIHREYDKTLNDLNEKIINLQIKNDELKDSSNIRQILDEQKHDIEELFSQVNSKLKSNQNEIENFYKYDIKELKNKLQKLHKNQSQIVENIESNVKNEYENYLKSERIKYLQELEQIKEQLNVIPTDNNRSVNSHQMKTTKLQTKRDTKLNAKIQKTMPKMYDVISESSNSDSEASNSKSDHIYKQEILVSNKKYKKSKNFNDKVKSRHNIKANKNIRQSQKEKKMIPQTSNTDTSDESSVLTQSKDRKTLKNPVTHTPTLKGLLDKNPGLWKQMKDIVKIELNNKTRVLTDGGKSTGINDKELNKYKAILKMHRQNSAKNNPDFYKLRKEFETEVDAIVQNRLLSSKNELNVSSNFKSSTKIIKERMEKLKSIVKNKSKQLKSSFNQDDIPKIQQQTNEDPELLKEQTVSLPFACKNYSTTTSSESSADESRKELEVDIHIEKDISEKMFSNFQNKKIKTPKQIKQDIYNGDANEYNSVSSSNSDEYIDLKNDSPKKEQILESLGKITEESDVNSEIKDTKWEEECKQKYWGSESDDDEPVNWTPVNHIKLKKPTSSKIKELAGIIEKQIINRNNEQPVGTIDIFSGNSIVLKHKNNSDNI